jgi:hypothetical protein
VSSAPKPGLQSGGTKARSHHQKTLGTLEVIWDLSFPPTLGQGEDARWNKAPWLHLQPPPTTTTVCLCWTRGWLPLPEQGLVGNETRET